MRNAILFVPHMDDELEVGGRLLYALVNSQEWSIMIVYATNGDYYKHESLIRLKEVSGPMSNWGSLKVMCFLDMEMIGRTNIFIILRICET